MAQANLIEKGMKGVEIQSKQRYPFWYEKQDISPISPPKYERTK